VGPVKETQ